MTRLHQAITITVASLLILVTTRTALPIQTCDEAGGTITRSPYRSQIATTTMYYSVYTPPCYQQSNRLYPVVYLMHGSNEDDGQWLRLGLTEWLDKGISAGTLPPLIAVMPFGEWLANQNQFEAVSWSNVFLDELMPLVESHYRIDARQETRAIGGISRGGFWAFNIAFRQPELFSAVGGHSAFFDDYHAPPEYNPLRLAAAAPGLDSLRIWLDRGQDDFAAPGLDLMDQRLTERGLAHQYTVYPEGQHYLTYWREHIGEYLQFYTAAWQNVPNTVPTPAPFIFATNTPAAVSDAPLAAATLPAPAQTPAAQPGLYLFLPAVAFPSLQTTLTVQKLKAVRAGQVDAQLILNETTATKLADFGILLPSEGQIVPDEALYGTLWRNRATYTLLPFDQLTPRYRVLRIQAADDDATSVHPLDSDLMVYPFAFTSETPNFYPDRLTRLLLSGVTALARNTREALDQQGVEWAGEAIKPYVDRADFFHTSNEVSFAADCPGKIPWEGAFCSKQDHFDLLTDIGLDIVELSGNHNNDYGTDAYLETLNWYREQGIRTVGGGENLEQARQPLILEHNGNRIAMLACNWIGPYYAIAGENSPGAAFCDWGWLRATLPQLAAETDLLVVTVQYEEFEDYQPTSQQQNDFRGLADLGAEVVIGTQAHKPQTFEFYNSGNGSETLIHYGLGNLFFDQPFWGNQRFFLDQLFIYEGRLLTVDLFTGIIDEQARPRPMTVEEQFNFLAFMFNEQGSF